jgi:hypothetical protein
MHAQQFAYSNNSHGDMAGPADHELFSARDAFDKNTADIGLYKQKTMDAVERYNESSGKPYKLSAAVGGKVFDFSSDDTQDLVVVIDTLMYKDKDDYYKDHKRER